MRYLTLAYIQYADGRRRPENDVTMFKTQVEPRANGFTAKFFRRQCSTLIFWTLGIGQVSLRNH